MLLDLAADEGVGPQGDGFLIKIRGPAAGHEHFRRNFRPVAQNGESVFLSLTEGPLTGSIGEPKFIGMDILMERSENFGDGLLLIICTVSRGMKNRTINDGMAQIATHTNLGKGHQSQARIPDFVMYNFRQLAAQLLRHSLAS